MNANDKPKKAYSKPVIEEVGRLDRFIDSGFNRNFNDSRKLTISPGMYIYFETSKASMANMM